MRLHGQDLVVRDGTPPTVTLAGVALTAVTAEDCVALAGPDGNQLCQNLVLPVSPDSLALGRASVAVHQPGFEACSAAATLSLEVLEGPELRQVTPLASCASWGTLTLGGAGFREGLRVHVGGVALADVQVVDATTAVASFAEGALSTGLHDVTVTLVEGCAHTLPEAVLIQPPPLVYGIEPPVVPAGEALEVLARLADVSGEPVDAWLVDDAGARTDADWTWDEARPEQLRVWVDGTLAPGTWRVGVALADGCEGDPGGALEVVEALSLTLATIEPDSAWTWDRTPVSITAPSPPPAGEVGLVDLPRAWLVGPDGQGTTRPLQGLTWRSPSEVTAVVPAELPVGRYDVVVVNPDGGLGWLDRALSVTPDAPPQVDSVQPASLESTGANDVVVRGRDFRDPAVDLLCREGASFTVLPLVVTSWSFSRIEAQGDGLGLNAAVCAVSVTNGDGTDTRYAGVSIRNPAQNLFPWEAGPGLNVARRAPAAVAGRTTSVTRYVYALGGDDGGTSSALDSLELAPMDLYGELGPWTLIDAGLPGPLTQAAATRIGDFVYLVGGDDGTGAVAQVWRARVLDPLDAPVINRVQVSTESGGGLSAGTWTYRIAALFDPTDPVNPGGESLPSDPFAVTLPWDGAAVTLSWDPVIDASSYRIYRSPAADAGSGTEIWLTDTAGSEHADLGDPADPILTPLSAGSLGAWAAQPDLAQARSGLCLGVARDPDPDPERYYLYAAGGWDGGPLGDLEVLDVQVVSDDEQRVGAWRTLEQTLDPPRTDCGLAVVDATLHTVVDDDTSWLYVLAGDDGTKTVGDVQAGLVQPGGDLDDWQAVKSLSPGRAGFAVASASDTLYAAGGQHGAPSGSGVSAELDGDRLPDLRNWNSLSTSFSEDRLLPGTAQESAVLVVMGGDTESGPTTTTDVTHY